jgi:hypothetical protein
MPAGYDEWSKLGVERGNNPLNGSGERLGEGLLSGRKGSNFAQSGKIDRQFGNKCAHCRSNLAEQVPRNGRPGVSDRGQQLIFG